MSVTPSFRRPRGGRSLLLAALAASVVVAGLVVASLALRDDGGDGATTATVDNRALFAGIPQDGAMLGSPSANVTFIQFEDLQCPICKRYQEDGFRGIVSEYVRTGKVRLRFAGLAFIGDDSEDALRYVVAAGRQDKLWQLADALYANQGGENSGWVSDALVDRLARGLGIDVTQLHADANSDAVSSAISAMRADAERLEVPGTPWFYVQVGDAAPYEVRPSSFSIDEFRGILDDALGG